MSIHTLSVSQYKELHTQRQRAEVLWFLLTTLKYFKFYAADKTRSAVFPPFAKTPEVFCVAEVVCTAFGKMATVGGGVILDFSRNNHLKCVESGTINTLSRKRKGCFGWIRFLKPKKTTTMQTDNYKYRIFLTA